MLQIRLLQSRVVFDSDFREDLIFLLLLQLKYKVLEISLSLEIIHTYIFYLYLIHDSSLYACNLVKQIQSLFCDVNLFQYNSCFDSDLMFSQLRKLLTGGKMLENLLYTQ